ncbi:hypothetical protein CTZ27_31945 [Streptomyces griseocarneus]|nr:hypothetical protein CTZ27_31945 [Streptomyces griseocarneus]
MAMSTDELKDRLRNGNFVLPGSDLAIPAADALFAEHLDGTLTITGAVLSDDTETGGGIVVSGHTTLPSATEQSTLLPVVVRFSCNTDHDVTGVEAEIACPAWTVESGRLQLDLTFLPEGFESLVLRLATHENHDGNLIPFAGVAMDAVFPGAGRLRLVSADESGGAGTVVSTHVLAGEFDPLPLSGLDALTGLPFARDVRLPPLPPEVTSVLEALALAGLRLTLDLSSRRIRAAWLDVRLAASWPVVPGVLELTDVGASFSLTLPTEPARDASVTVTASAKIADTVTAAASITVPGLILTTQVTTPVNLFPAAEQFLRAAGENMPRQGSHFGAVVDLRAKSYTLSFGVDAPWPVVPGALELTDLELTMSGAQGRPWAGTLHGAFLVDDTPVQLRASYDQGTWDIAGAAYGIRFARLADWLSRQYRITVPRALAEFTLDELSVTCAKPQDGQADFALRFAGTLPVADLLLNADLTVSRTSQGWEWQGDLLIDVPSDTTAHHLMRFTIAFGTSPSATELTAHWSGTPGVSLADLARAFGPVPAQLPPALTPVLTDVGLVHDTDGIRRSLVLNAEFEHLSFVLASASPPVADSHEQKVS